MRLAKKIGIAFVGVLVIATVSAWLFLPGFVRGKLIAAADAHGVDLRVGDVEVGFHHVVLHDITAAVRALPELQVAASEVDVQHTWLEVESVDVRRADVQLTGDPSVLSQHASTTLAGETPTTTEPWVSVSGKLTWKRNDATLSCDEGTASLNATARGDVALDCKMLRWTVGSLSFGPWQLQANHSTQRGDFLNVDLSKSPASTLAVSRTPDGRTAWDVSVDRQRTNALGVPNAALSLVSLDGPPTVSAKVHYEWLAHHATGSFDLASDAAPVAKGRTMPVHVSGKLEGDPDGDLGLSSGSATVGAFSGTLGGTVHVATKRADLVFDSQVLSCQEAGAQLTAQAFGPLGQQLGGLVHALGVDQGVKGSMTLHADAAIDFGNLGASKVTTKTGGDCAVDLFP